MDVSLDATSIWAEINGAVEELDSIECTLRETILQVAGNSKSGSSTWIRYDTSIKVLAGLLPVAFPDMHWPLGYTMRDSSGMLDSGVQSRLDVLGEHGWRDYQIEAILAALEAPLGRGIIELGTGAGKTRVAWGLAYVAGGPWAYCVYGKDLVAQSASSFAELCSEIGPVAIDTMGWDASKVGSQEYTGIIIDECHGVSARTRAHCLSAFRGCLRIGLSGTPLDRTDSKNPLVVGLLGPVIYKVGVAQLTKEGFLTPGRVVIC